MSVLNITTEIWRKGNWFLASAPELDFVSQGHTSEDAKRNLLEVIKNQFDEMSVSARSGPRRRSPTTARYSAGPRSAASRESKALPARNRKIRLT